MHKYFRKNAPVPNGFYLSQEIMDDINIRMAVARNCHFPSLISTLANDEADQVRKVAYQNEFWQLLGRFQDVLDFAKRERLFLASHEDSFNLLTLFMFERDLEVFENMEEKRAIEIDDAIKYADASREKSIIDEWQDMHKELKKIGYNPAPAKKFTQKDYKIRKSQYKV